MKMDSSTGAKVSNLKLEAASAFSLIQMRTKFMQDSGRITTTMVKENLITLSRRHVTSLSTGRI